MSNTFREALDISTSHEESWYQGRGVYGGLVFAQMAVGEYKCLGFRFVDSL